MKVTFSEFVNIVHNNISGTKAISVDLDAPMDSKGKMNVKGNPYAGLGIVKRETLNGMVGYIYINAVNRIAVKDAVNNGEKAEEVEVREAKQHPWGDLDSSRCFRIHRTNGQIYLVMKVESATVYGYFLPDGTEIAKENLAPFLPKKSKSSTQEGLSTEVIARDFALKNITEVRAWGTVFNLIPNLTLTESEKVEAEKVAGSIEVAAETVS